MGYREVSERYFDDEGRWLDTKTRIEPWAPDGAPAPPTAAHWASPQEPEKSQRNIIVRLLNRLNIKDDCGLRGVDQALLIDAACNQLWLIKHKRATNVSDPLAAFRHQLRLGYTHPSRCAEILKEITRELRPPEATTAAKPIASKEDWAVFQRQIAEFLERRGQTCQPPGAGLSL
jgi:hypothetical protein